jgi:L-ascorbate metabolism protein UlaG (beta-lactamase superfamily)
VGAFEIIGVPAANEDLAQDEAGRHKFLGYIVRFGPWTQYHSGDTLWYGGMVDHLRPYAIDLAILPINGRAPERRVAGNLNGQEAAELACRIGARLVVPCHYEMFEFNTAAPDTFIATAQKLGQPYQVLRAGERWQSTAMAA